VEGAGVTAEILYGEDFEPGMEFRFGSLTLSERA